MINQTLFNHKTCTDMSYITSGVMVLENVHNWPWMSQWISLIFDKPDVLTVNTQHFLPRQKCMLTTNKISINYYLSLTDTRSTDDEKPCSASSDFPAIFVASTPWAKASSQGTLPFGTVAVGAAN